MGSKSGVHDIEIQDERGSERKLKLSSSVMTSLAMKRGLMPRLRITNNLVDTAG